MGKIRFVDGNDTRFVRVLDIVAERADTPDPDISEVSMEEQTGQAIRQIFPGGPSELQLFAVQCEPDVRGQVHAHLVDEIIYVVEGEIIFGARTYRAGSAVYIPGETMYSFRSGPNGLTFLNFRGQADDTFLTREDWAAQRADEEASPADVDSSDGASL